MKYYIVVIEWNYPTESGRDIIDDFDTIEMARRVAKEQVDKEYDNFLEVNDGHLGIHGPLLDDNHEIEGYGLNTEEDHILVQLDNADNMYFRSRIIEMDTNLI